MLARAVEEAFYDKLLSHIASVVKEHGFGQVNCSTALPKVPTSIEPPGICRYTCIGKQIGGLEPMLLDEFRSLVLSQLSAQVPDHVGAIKALKNDDDLLASGLVDSYALIELCLALEAQTGAMIDIGTLAPEQFGSIGALFDVVTASNSERDKASGAGLRFAS
jgi:acyl carrier protein